MKNEIDFLKGSRGEKEKRLKLLRMVKTGSILFLLFYCLLAAAFFSYNFYLQTQAQKITKESTLKKNKIESLKEIETLQIALKQRLSTLDKFFAAQKGPNFPTLLDYFDQLTQEIIVRELSIGSDGKITLAGELSDTFVLESFLERLNQPETSKFFSTVTLSSLDKKETGGYSFIILLEAKI